MTEIHEALRQSDNVDVQRVGYWLTALERELTAFIVPDCVDRRKELMFANHTSKYLQTAIRDAKSSY
jgi:hypothetical protein